MTPDASLKNGAIQCARRLADHLCDVQALHNDSSPASGSYPYLIFSDGREGLGCNWNHAFAIMGLLAAHKTFDEPRYETTALRMARWLKSLQIFDPFRPANYGALREMTPQTPWSYPRDAISVAWSFIELYRHTNDEEYLERARLFGEWFVNNALDEDGWPLWGFQFEPFFDHPEPQICNDCQGSFHGGSLNFFYQLAQATGDSKWTGDFYINMADILAGDIQQDSGLYITIDRATKKTPGDDPQDGLHKANDDLSTLGLLGAYKTTGNEEYLRSIERFLTGVMQRQEEDGMYDNTVAAIPVVTNILHEVSEHLPLAADSGPNTARALKRMIDSQYLNPANPRMYGGLREYPEQEMVCDRSGCYALIVLLKLYAGTGDYLTV